MRRLFAIGFTAVLVAGLVGIGYLSLFSGGPSVAERRAAIAADAVAILLVERYGVNLETVTAGREIGEGGYDFRGALAGDLRGRAAVYGVVELTCDSPTRDPDCWRLVSFERDGEPWSPAAAAAARQVNINLDVSAQALSEAAAGVEPPVESAPLQAKVETQEAPTLFAATAPVVNGRGGPGTGYAIVAKIAPEDRLELIERRDGWGRFRIVGVPANAAGAESWIWLELVEPIGQGGGS